MRRHGFTIVELLVVMALLGVLTAIAAPRLRPSPVQEVEGVARLAAQDAEQARTRAWATRELTRMRIRDSTVDLYLDHDGNGVFGERLVERQAFGGTARRFWPRGVVRGLRPGLPRLPMDTLGSLPTGHIRVTYGPRGMPEPFGTSVFAYWYSQRDSASAAAIAINAAGNVQVFTWRDSTWR